MRILFIFFALTFCARNFAQENTIILELAGNAQGASLNYERRLTKEKNLMLSIGFGSAFVDEEPEPSILGSYFSFFPEERLSIPISLRYLISIKNENYLEIGSGYTWINVNKNFESTERGRHNFIAEIGYRRYFGKQDDWVWRANFSPILAGNGSSGIALGFSPMAGISIGKRF